jgi:hypothetical protein
MSESNTHMRNTAPETLWFIARGDTMRGPFTVNQIADKVASRELSALDYCWRQGFSEWRPINSVEEFDRRGKIKTLSPYPSVEIPGTSRLRGKPAEATEAPSQLREGPRVVRNVYPNKKDKIEVTFARVRRGPLSIYEWAGALVFTLVFTFLAVDFALSEVEKKYSTRIEWLEMGQLKVEGALPSASDSPDKYVNVSPAWMWEPLLSANGVRELERNYKNNYLEPGVPTLPRTYVDYYVQGVDESQSQGTRSPASESTHKPKNIVSAGFTRKQGYLSFSDQFKIRILPQGSPELP